MTIEHDEYLFLRIAIDAAHSDVDVVVAVDPIHTGDIGRQHFLQVAGSAVVNHLGGDERSGNRCLSQTLRLTGGCGNGGGHTGLDTVHYIGKGRRIARRRSVVGILLKHQRGVLSGLLHIEASQIAECNETEGVLSEIAMEGAEILQQGIAGLFDATYLVVALGLGVYIAHLRVDLGTDGYRLKSEEYEYE